MLKQVWILSFALVSMNAQAAKVAVVDSGTDFSHTKIRAQAWMNPLETAADRIDNDKNGKVDDINGWNFAENYGRVFFAEHLRDVNPVVYPLFRVIAHRQAGTITPDEEKFLQENLLGLPEAQRAEALAHLNFFGVYAHGTHVAGIVLGQSPSSQILSARMFPDDVAPLYPNPAGRVETKGLQDWIYKLLAAIANGSFQQVGKYLGEQQVDVANYSLGMSLPMIAKQFLAMRGKKDPTDAEVAAEVRRVYAQFEPQGKKWMAAAPKTLFVIAAGNDALDNDQLPAFPASIRADNSISVAASQGYEKLGSFSNYGATSVDVAAPGVAVMSAVPSLEAGAELPMSGTSMAAPFVAGVAARVKDANSDLQPAQIRQILMGTVDNKDWLVGKVISAGVVNADRAALAAELSRQMSLEQAMAQARLAVADRADGDHGPQRPAGALPLDPNDPAARILVF